MVFHLQAEVWCLCGWSHARVDMRDSRRSMLWHLQTRSFTSLVERLHLMTQWIIYLWLPGKSLPVFLSSSWGERSGVKVLANITYFRVSGGGSYLFHLQVMLHGLSPRRLRGLLCQIWQQSQTRVTTLSKSVLKSQWLIEYGLTLATTSPKCLSSSEMLMSIPSCVDGVPPSVSLLHPLLITSQDHKTVFSWGIFAQVWEGGIGRRS